MSVKSEKSVDNIVTDNLDSIIAAPDGIKRLRELILHLAVQGKLVEQRPEGGTADELLRQIKEAKRRDAEDRKVRGERISKQKPLSPIEKNEIPFEIPNAWKWVRLGMLISNPRYGTSKKCDYKTGATGVLRIPNVVRGYVDDSDLKFANFDETELVQYRLEDGDILAIRSNGSKSLVGRCAVVSESDTKYAYAGYLIRLRPFLLNSHYLLACFNSASVRGQIESRAKSTSGVNNVNAQEMSALILPLPPLAEQKRIVAKVDELMAWCDELDALKQKRDTLQRAALKSSLRDLCDLCGEKSLTRIVSNFSGLIRDPADVKQLRDAILQLAVQGRLVPQRKEDGTADELLTQIKAAKATDLARRKANNERIRKTKPLPAITEEEIPFDIPKNWKWVRLGEYGEWGAGSTPNRKNSEYYNGNYSWFKSGELNDKKNLKGSVETVTEIALAECSLRQNKIGDVLIAMYGATIGKLAILGEEGTTNQAVCACTCNDELSNVFLFNLLMAWRVRFSEQGAGGAQPNISRIKIVNTVVPLPPLAEQQRIVAKVDELMAWCDELETRLQTQSDTAARFAAAIAKT